MLVTEGSASQEIFLPNTHVIKIEKKDPKKAFGVIYGEYDLEKRLSPFPGLEIKIVEYAPNAYERMETWIKNDQLFLTGVPQGWSAIHRQTNDTEYEVKKEYFKDLTITLTERSTGKIIYKGDITGDLENIDIDLIYGSLELVVDGVSIALQGPNALVNKSKILIDLERKPKLAFFQDMHGDIQLYFYGAHGEIQKNLYRANTLDSLIVYDKGFGGYAVQEKITSLKSRKEIEAEIHKIIESELRNASENNVELSPPLEILKQACVKSGADFPKTCLEYLVNWDNSGCWLYPEQGPAFAGESEIVIEAPFLASCYWADKLFVDDEPIEFLRSSGYQLPAGDNPLNVITQQIFAAGNMLPAPHEAPVRKGRLLSALFRACEIHLGDFKPNIPNEADAVFIEAPLTLRSKAMPPMNKIEENIPKITLEIRNGPNVDYISLVYNMVGTGIKIPGLDGEYLFRFQPKSLSIPYRVRLRNARQINYANSSQTFSYEADLQISGEDKTISMNRVHETWEGYRFYLSNISPQNETAVKRVQLAVNHDPLKYFLTYPGGLIVALGSILLFWRKNKK